MNKRNSVIILSILIMTILFSVIPSSVIATSTTIPVGFEGSVPGTSYSATIGGLGITSTPRAGSFNCTATYDRSGTRAFSMDGSNYAGWINLSYSPTSYLSKFSFYNNHINENSAVIYISFINKTSANGNMNIYMVKLTVTVTTLSIGYYNSANASVTITTGNYQRANNWDNYVSFEITNNIGDCQYIYNDIGGNMYYANGTVRDAIGVNTGKRIDSIYFSSNNQFMAIDDINVTLSDSYSGGDMMGCLDVTGLTQVGHFAYSSYTYSYPYLIKKYHVPVTTSLRAVNLECNLAQLSDDGNLANYGLYINGVYCGMPTCNYVTGDDVVFQWAVNVTLVDEAPVFVFYHSQKTSAGHYWKVGTSTYAGASDLDSDGDTTYYLAGSSYTPSSDYPGSYSMSSYGDLGMMWFCTGFTTTSTYSYGDSLGLSYYDYQNATGYVYDIQNPHGVVCQYTLSTTSRSYNCVIQLWINGTQSNLYGFPQSVTYPSGSIAISPITIGKYQFRLYSYHYVANATAWLTGTPGNYQIFINPKISNQFASYQVTCRYYHPQGLSGRVGVFTNSVDVNVYSKALYTYPLTTNASTTVYYSSNSSGAEYWQLFAYSTVYSPVGQYSIHYVRLTFAVEPAITVTPSTIKLGEGTTVRATHNMPGADVSIYMNNVLWQSVSGNQVTQMPYTPTKTGAINVTMKVRQNTSTVTLAYTMLYVTTADGGTGDGGIPGITRDLIPVEYRLYVGIGVIIGFTLLPTLVLLSYVKHSQSDIKIPALPLTVTTIIMSLIGFILTIVWGLMPWYSVFLILFVLILYLGILMYKGGNKED